MNIVRTLSVFAVLAPPLACSGSHQGSGAAAERSEAGRADAALVDASQVDGDGGQDVVISQDSGSQPDSGTGQEGGDGGLPGSDACSSGQFLIELASGEFPIGIVVDATSVYWTSHNVQTSGMTATGSVMKAPLGGCTATTLATNAANLDVDHVSRNIAVDATSVYWTTLDPGPIVIPASGNYGSVMKVPVGGGTVTTLATGQHSPSAIALDATNVYWTNSGASGGNDGAVMAVPIGGGTVTTLATGQDVPSAIAVDATSVYWTNSGTIGSGTVMKVPIGGGAAITLVSGSDPQGVAVDATSVYWTNGWAYNSTVMKVPLGGGTATTLASGQIHPTEITVDGTSVYWTNGKHNPAGSAVMKVPVDGGATTTLAVVYDAWGITVDTTSVYWLGSGPNVSSVTKLTPK